MDIQMAKRAYNPYLPSYEYIPDGEPYVFGDRLYIFGSHDRYDGTDYCENDYVCWSAPVEDLSDWHCEGVIYRREQDPHNVVLKRPLQAPDVQPAKDGRYYLYYCPAGVGSIGVAVCDRPGGRYTFLGHVHRRDMVLLGDRKGDGFPFDPGIFRDKDERIWLYYGFAPMNKQMDSFVNPDGLWKSGPYVAELEADMLTIKGEPRPVEILDCPGKCHDFFEASSMRRINGKYYFIYSSQNSHELCYALGESPAGPFRYGGVLHSNGDIGMPGITEENQQNYTGNNHGSLVEIKGQWYIFGHRMTNYTLFSRQGVAEPVEIEPDGHISQAEMTSGGLGGMLPWEGSFEARIACVLRSENGAVHYGVSGEMLKVMKSIHPAFVQEGGDRESDPDQYITHMMNGAVAGFKYFEACGSREISVVTRGSAGRMEVSTADGQIVAVIPLESGETWHVSERVPLAGMSGRQSLFFTYYGNGAVDFRLFTLWSDN